MTEVEFPEGNWIVLANGSWNEWSWGQTLEYNSQNGFYEGSICDLNSGNYQYVYSITGDFDNWSGWGMVGNAPFGTNCDYNPGDQWGNYGFSIENSDITLEYNKWGQCGLDDIINQSEILLRPFNGQILNYIHVPFEWKQLPDNVGYTIQVSNTTSFDTIIFEKNEESTLHFDTNNLDWNQSYYWRIRPNYSDDNIVEWSDIGYFQTGDFQFDLEATLYDSIDSLILPYTIFGDWNNYRTSIIDIDGKEIWNSGNFGFMLSHINEKGQLFGSSSINYPINRGIEINYDQEVIWSAGIALDQHEFKKIPNGNYMGLKYVSENGPIPLGAWTSAFQQLGYIADGLTNEFSYSAQEIVEFDEYTGEEVWNWNPHNYFSKLDVDLYGGTWWQSLGNLHHDWTHSNAFYFDENENMIYLSSRHLSKITKIDYNTGEIVWTMGLPSEFMFSGDDHICTDLKFSFQHHIQRLDNGDLLFFDNGNLDQTIFNELENTSRAIRVRVVDDSYCEVIWEYELPSDLFGAGMGSVQLLDNGNYFINTTGDGGTLIELDENKNIIWDIKLGLNWPSGSGYRAYRVPSLHPGIFSIYAANYRSTQNNSYENGIELTNLENFIKFTINNKSGYSLDYNYEFNNINGDSFEDIQDIISINLNSSIDIYFHPNNDIDSLETIQIKVWPKDHKYLEKNISFNVYFQDIDFEMGDINNDLIIDVIDILIIVNHINENILNDNQFIYADMNYDQNIDISDIILIIDVILNN